MTRQALVVIGLMLVAGLIGSHIVRNQIEVGMQLLNQILIKAVQ